MLRTDDDIQPQVSFDKPVMGVLLWANVGQMSVTIKPAAQGTAELVHEKLCLARVGRPHDEFIEGDIARIHFNTTQIPAVCSLCGTGSRR